MGLTADQAAVDDDEQERGESPAWPGATTPSGGLHQQGRHRRHDRPQDPHFTDSAIGNASGVPRTTRTVSSSSKRADGVTTTSEETGGGSHGAQPRPITEPLGIDAIQAGGQDAVSGDHVGRRLRDVLHDEVGPGAVPRWPAATRFPSRGCAPRARRRRCRDRAAAEPSRPSARGTPPAQPPWERGRRARSDHARVASLVHRQRTKPCRSVARHDAAAGSSQGQRGVSAPASPGAVRPRRRPGAPVPARPRARTAAARGARLGARPAQVDVAGPPPRRPASRALPTPSCTV